MQGGGQAIRVKAPGILKYISIIQLAGSSGPGSAGPLWGTCSFYMTAMHSHWMVSKAEGDMIRCASWKIFLAAERSDNTDEIKDGK